MTIPGTALQSKQPGRNGEEPVQDFAQNPPSTGFQKLISRLAHDWVLVACILLTGSLCFGLGLLISRETNAPKDSLWIEQLPASVMPGSVGTSSEGSATRENGAHRTPSSTQQQPIAQPAAAAGAPTNNHRHLPGFQNWFQILPTQLRQCKAH